MHIDSKPIFSIIMPAYNSSKTITLSIESALNQTYNKFELIIVDDFSSDGTREIIDKYQKYDIRVSGYFLEKNMGVSYARNCAIRLARGKFITFLDSDDIWLPTKLQKQLNVFNDGALVIYSQYIRFYESGNHTTVVVPLYLDYRSLLCGNCIGNLTGAYDCEKLGKFYQNAVGHEDYLMWLRILKTGVVAIGIQESLAMYRVVSTSLSRNKLKSACWTWIIYRKHLDLSIMRTMYCFFMYMINSIAKRF
jgi:glycosyltransferase involved in cell wall biosynthesis